MAFGESKDILLTKRKGGDARGNDSHQFQREPTGEEGSEGGTMYEGLEQIFKYLFIVKYMARVANKFFIFQSKFDEFSFYQARAQSSL